jgi:group I intron endonuclease
VRRSTSTIYGRIYLITNRVNGKVYVGQTRSSVRYRWKNHISQSNSGCKYYFHSAIRKYGEHKFTVSTIQDCYSEQDLDDAEEYWISYYQSFTDRTKGYNTTSGGRHPNFREPLNETQIEAAARNWYIKNGEWPSRRTKREIPELPGESWEGVNDALRRGCRGLPEGSSLYKFLAFRGFTNRCVKKNLTKDKIWEAAKSWYNHNGEWPSERTKGKIPELPNENWSILDHALVRGLRGLPGGSSLPQLLASRGISNRCSKKDLTEDQVWIAAQNWYTITGRWPTQHTKGEIPGLTGENWDLVSHALINGFRGLPGGSSLPKFLTSRGVTNRCSKMGLTESTIWKAAQNWFTQEYQWPSQHTKGEIPELPGYNWNAINSALKVGGRGLPKGSSLSKVLASHGATNRGSKSNLTEDHIWRAAQAWHTRTGRWPSGYTKGIIPELPGDTWNAIGHLLYVGGRGLLGKSSLSKLLLSRDSNHRWSASKESHKALKAPYRSIRTFNPADCHLPTFPAGGWLYLYALPYRG